MSEREHILSALVAEVLGPRYGPRETLPQGQDPRDEYITGVLAPVQASAPPEDTDPDTEALLGDASDADDEDSTGPVLLSTGFSPALDPKSLPRSIGLSFTVQAASGTPAVEICATWARYQQRDETWSREPSSFLTGPVDIAADDRWSAGPGVELRLRSRLLQTGQYRLSIFLVNTTPVQPATFVPTQSHIFQPQIRVHCCRGTGIIPVNATGANGYNPQSLAGFDAEEASLNLLYRDRTALARGHMCGATWAEIDPERPHPSGRPLPAVAPFFWLDAEVVLETERHKFSPADVRTELVPLYPVAAPAMDWDDPASRPPVLDPDHLAEVWRPDELRHALMPIVIAYWAWINAQRRLIQTLATSHQGPAASHLEQCRTAADRIRQGIDILAQDEDARLAFCFANKAIALQASWSRRGSPRPALRWRPFQLAFILLNIPALADPHHPDRQICDLLWFPTGGGKTEAYLGLTAFTLALRRRRSLTGAPDDPDGGGVGVLSRYTLRLLTIQQFRRALGVTTACEMLRVHGLDNPAGSVGWRPAACPSPAPFLWGGMRFSAGLWVGGGVTPNNLLSIGPFPADQSFTLLLGALDILRGGSKGYRGPHEPLRKKIQGAQRVQAEGEPAQVPTCPCCGAILAIPTGQDEGLGPGQHTLHFLFHSQQPTSPGPTSVPAPHTGATIDRVLVTPHRAPGYHTASITLTVSPAASLRADLVDDWWQNDVVHALGRNVELVPARPARPGYFILDYTNARGNDTSCDFDIYCPNPACDLNQHAWAEQVPLARTITSVPTAGAGSLSLGVQPTAHSAGLPIQRGLQWQETPDAFRRDKTCWIADRIPIPACTVDDQIYHRCPSLVIATVDKFARLAHEPKAAALFGNVDHYHSRWGYYRAGAPPLTGLSAGFRQHPPGHDAHNGLHLPVRSFRPPALIIQDELHLIEGPLGSMVGLYESAIDLLCRSAENGSTVMPKYIASTATVRQAENQVQAIFNRRLAQFPPPGLSASDRFFARDRGDQELHPLDSDIPGRLYVAVCAPGKGPQTPIVRIWSALLQSAQERWQATGSASIDGFYTLVGYFNAIRELAGGLALFRQDIPERIAGRCASDSHAHTPTASSAQPRQLDRFLELSSRASSLALPSLLARLETTAPEAEDAVFATSMFGTGVDVNRLGLMVVHGQPKTTASYIQATGRVGRQRGGLIVTFYRASRPRDLDHYEFFTGYHRALYRYVEPVTVAPFSPRARERALGPLAVILLRHARDLAGHRVSPDWKVQQRLSGAYHALAYRMAQHRFDPEVLAIPDLLEQRAQTQPAGRRPAACATSDETASELDRWRAGASQNADTNNFVYSESTYLRPPERRVVLGDPQHQARPLWQAFENAPQSLREVEETTTFKG